MSRQGIAVLLLIFTGKHPIVPMYPPTLKKDTRLGKFTSKLDVKNASVLRITHAQECILVSSLSGPEFFTT
jgi:hypothetical protein